MASRRQKVDQSVYRARPTSDLISHLPADVTVNILVHLPLQEAVKTSLLSKKWMYKWTTIPQLVFDSSTFSAASKHKLVSRGELLAIIQQVLLQHEGPISKFTMSIPQLGSCPEINHLISFLSRKNIEEFTLYISEGKPHKIPLYLYSCLQMRLLCLHRCVLSPPSGFTGFAKLTNLELCAVDLPILFSTTFVAKCPLLECLKLHDCTNLDRVNFYAPNLQLLDYLGRSVISSVSFIDTPRLKKVSIEYVSSSKIVSLPWMGNIRIDVFCSLPSLEYLQLGPHFILLLDTFIVGGILGRRLNCLVTLVLSLSLRPERVTGYALWLIKGSPNLQKLVIKLSSPSKVEDEGCFSIVKEYRHFSLGKLKSVEMSSFSGLSSHIAFIELLLARSPMLKTVRIYYLKGCSLDQKFSASQKINQVTRASPRAKVIFLEPIES